MPFLSELPRHHHNTDLHLPAPYSFLHVPHIFMVERVSKTQLHLLGTQKLHNVYIIELLLTFLPQTAHGYATPPTQNLIPCPSNITLISFTLIFLCSINSKPFSISSSLLRTSSLSTIVPNHLHTTIPTITFREFLSQQYPYRQAMHNNTSLVLGSRPL